MTYVYITNTSILVVLLIIKLHNFYKKLYTAVIDVKVTIVSFDFKYSFMLILKKNKYILNTFILNFEQSEEY